MAIDGSISLPLLDISGQVDGHSGSINLGDPDNFGSVNTPLSLAASSLGSAAFNGKLLLSALTLSGSLEGPLALAQFTLSATGVAGTLDDADVLLPVFSAAGLMLVGEAADGATLLPAYTLDGSTGVRGDAVLAPLTLDAAGLVGRVDLLVQLALPGLTLSGAIRSELLATGDLTLLAPTLDGAGLAGNVGAGDLALLVPALDGAGLAGTAPSGDATFPAFTLSAATADGAAASASITLPALTLSGTMPAAPVDGSAVGSAILAQATLSGFSLNGTLASASLALAAPTLSGVLANSPPGVGDLLLAEFTLAGTGLSADVGGALIRLPQALLSAQAVNGAVGSADIELPLLALSAHDGVLDVVGTAHLQLPLFQLSASLLAAQLASATFTGIALNTRTKAVTEYAGLAPNSIARFNDLTLMATASGIVALSAANDQGVAIDARLLSAKSDLGNPVMKRIATGYVGLSADGDLEMTLIADDHHEFVYQLQPRRTNELHNTRVKFGRGVAGVYWQWKVANVAGAAFAINRVELHPATTGSRV